jgi:hypothetical protein
MSKDKVFISYSHLDFAWAKKLHDDLVGRNFSVFLDTERLNAGRKWNKDLQSAIRNSEHLLVIWSPNAEKSQWVSMEMAYFESDKQDDATRLHIHLNLDGENTVFSDYQKINLIRDKHVDPSKIADLDNYPGLWSSVIDRIDRSISDEDGTPPVYKLILTSTLDTLVSIPLDHAPAFAPAYEVTLKAIGVRNDNSDLWKSELKKYYSADRSLWRPFGGTKAIGDLLTDMKVKIDQQKGAPKFRWKEVDPSFWGSQDQMNSEIQHLAGQMTMVVVDPVSLYDEDVRRRWDAVRHQLMDDRTMISVLAPFPLPAVAGHLRELIKGSTQDLYDFFYTPPFIAAPPLTHINVCALDDLDLRRLLGSALRAQFAAKPTPSVFVKGSI